MKIHTGNLYLLLALLAVVGLFSGCATNEPDNASGRPWNSSEGWQNGVLSGMDYQHR